MEVGGALAAGDFHQHLHQAGGGIERVARLSTAHGLGDAAPSLLYVNWTVNMTLTVHRATHLEARGGG